MFSVVGDQIDDKVDYTSSSQGHEARVPHIKMGNRKPIASLKQLAGGVCPRKGSPSKVLSRSTSRFNLVGKSNAYQKPTPESVPVKWTYPSPPQNVLGKRTLREIQSADPPIDSCSVSVDSPRINPVDEYSTEEAASQLLNLNKAESHHGLSSGGYHTSYSESPTASSQSGHLRIRRKSNEIERNYDCCFCEKRYGSVSALTLHLRQKHSSLVKEMYALHSTQDLRPIHARSVAAYVNNALTIKHVRPLRNAEQAIAESAPDKCTNRSSTGSKHTRSVPAPRSSIQVEMGTNNAAYTMAPMAALGLN